MYFLAGVANVEIFKGTESFATAKTLLDSSITIGVSAEDIRAGKGAKLYGKYFHTSTFDLKLSDAMFKMEYIAANVGADLELGGDVFTIEEHINEIQGDFKINLKQTPVSMTIGGVVYVYYKKQAEEYYKTIKIHSGSNSFIIPNADIGKYCVKYLYTNSVAQSLSINTNFTPNTLSVYLTSNLYSGYTDDIATGTKIGEILIKIPRFLLSGNQEIVLNMTGHSEVQLEGIALATNDGLCGERKIYAEIIEIIENRTLRDLVMIKIKTDEDGIVLFSKPTESLKVYGKFFNTSIMPLKNSLLTFSLTNPYIISIDEEGYITPMNKGTTQLTVSCGSVSDTVLVTVLVDYCDDGIIVDDNTILLVENDIELSYI